MWAHVPQTPPTVIGSMMPSYATQPLQYQTCFMPPLQHTNQGMYYNNQVQSYSVVPQQYIPMANQGFRQHLMMRQPPNVPYIMHHDYVAVANSGYSHMMTAGTPSLQPQFIPSDFHTREAVYEMSSFQHGPYVPQYPKPLHQGPAFGERRTEILNQQPSNVREEREEQGGINFSQSFKEEQSSDLHKSCSSADTVTTMCEQAPTPLHLYLLDEAEPVQADASHSPSETTLVPSPSSSDGAQTVCSSPFHPVHSDTEEENELTTPEDDQIPTKDTNDEVTFSHATLEPCLHDNAERLEPEQPYDNATIKPSNEDQNDSYLRTKTKPLLKEDLCSVQNVTICSSSLEGDVTLKHSSTKDCVETFTAPESSTSANQSQHRHHHHQPIRCLIDTPVYNTAHSRVLSQLTRPKNDSVVQPHKGITQRPLTTHFRQLFKPIPFSSKKDIKGSKSTK